MINEQWLLLLAGLIFGLLLLVIAGSIHEHFKTKKMIEEARDNPMKMSFRSSDQHLD